MADPRVTPAAEADNAYALLTALVVPRPIAWVSTVSADGVGNLAPHSFFTVASAQPPMVQFTSVGHKDSVRNVAETGEFVVSLASEAMIDAINATSARYDADVDEAEAVGVAMADSTEVRPPRVAAAPAALECRLHRLVEVGDSVLVIGEVVAFVVDEAMWNDGHPTVADLRPLARLGGEEWMLPGPVVTRRRPARP